VRLSHCDFKLLSLTQGSEMVPVFVVDD